MAAVAQIVIEVDEKGAVRSLNNLSGQTQKLDPTLRKVGQSSNVVFTGMQKDHDRATQSIRLVSESIGVGVPRALQRVIASSAVARTALSAVFNVAAPVAIAIFAFQQITAAIEAIEAKARELSGKESLARRIWGLDSVNRERFHAALKQNEELTVQIAMATASDTQKISIQLADDLRKINEQLESAKITEGMKASEKLERTILLRKQLAAAQLLDLARKNAIDVAEAEGAALEQGALRRGQAEQQAIDQLKEARSQAAVAGLSAEQAILQKLDEEIAKIRELAKQYPSLRGQAEATVAALTDAAARERTKIYEDELKRRDEILDQEQNDRIAAESRGTEEIVRMEQDAAIAVLPPWQRADAQIVLDHQRTVEELKKQLDRGEIDNDQFLRGRNAAWAKANAELRDNMANELERLFDDITSGNIGKRIRDNFKHLFFQILAQWILTMQGMRTATAGGGPGGTPPFFPGGAGGGAGGGIFGGILGGLLGLGGLGGGGGIGGTPPFIGQAGGLSFIGGSNVPLSGGGGAGAGTTLPGAQKGLLDILFSHGIGKLSGGLVGLGGLSLAIAGLSRGGVLGTIAGIGGAALTGFAIGGPIGAIIGGIIGAIGAIFGSGARRRKREQLEADVMRQINQVESAYKVFQADYGSTFQGLEQIRQQGLDALAQIGSRDQSTQDRRVNRHIDQAEKEINDIEAQRAKNAQVIAGLPLPEFQGGGIVRAISGSNGRILAFLHDREGVLTPRAVNALGEDNLSRLNRGEAPNLGGGSTINVMPGAIVINATPGMDPQAIANLTIAQLRRALNAAGVRTVF
jgi:hypothetical protein